MKDEFAGKKTTCPSCQTGIRVPTAIAVSAATLDSTPPATRIPPVVVATEMSSVPNLIACQVCGNQVATSAAACQKCGAPNKWVHPEIERFRNSIGQFDNLQPFDTYWTPLVLKGVAKVKRGNHAIGDFGVKAMAVGVLAMLFGSFLPESLGVLVPWIIGPLSLFIAAC